MNDLRGNAATKDAPTELLGTFRGDGSWDPEWPRLTSSTWSYFCEIREERQRGSSPAALAARIMHGPFAGMVRLKNMEAWYELTADDQWFQAPASTSFEEAVKRAHAKEGVRIA